MRCSCLAVVLLAIGLVLSGCSSNGISATASHNPGYGPFDEDGNYVEAWADKPAKKHRWSSKPTPTPEPKPEQQVAKNEPPRSAPSQPSSRSGVPIASLSRPASTRPPAPKPTSRPATSTSSPKPKPRPPVVAASTAPKPKPKPVQAKPKKPAPIRYTVKKGDTLYSLSRKYGTSVSAIQRANDISGTNIRIGQTLAIPR